MRWAFFLIFILFLTACDSPDNSTEISKKQTSLTNKPDVEQDKTKVEAHSYPPLQPTVLMQEPTKVYVFETAAEALSVWRRAKDQRPTLLLLSNNPYLRPVPEALHLQASRLINNADLDSLRLATSDRSPSPIILPQMAIDSALRNGFFSELAWALPIRDTEHELSLKKFREQLIGAGLINEDESNSMSLEEEIFTASIRDIPFRAAPLSLIKGLQGPVIVHIDLSYFQPIYKNEISTPLLDIVKNVLLTLKTMHLQTVAVTFSHSHLDNQISLDVRFLSEIIASLIEGPSQLEQPIPSNWQRQRDALYLANFFQKEKIRELFLAQEQDAPEKAWIKFNLYRSAAEHKEGNKALDYLTQAVELDSMYALEYFALSDMAYEKKRPHESLRMLGLAAKSLPEDPIIKLQMAQLANELGMKEMSLKLLDEIRMLEWSNIYYPQMPQYLSELTTFVETGEMTDQRYNDSNRVENYSGQTYPPEDVNSRQRVLHKK